MEIIFFEFPRVINAGVVTIAFDTWLLNKRYRFHTRKSKFL
ncbi:MAG: hypothetical protein ACTSVI_04120 [Promethearchaeota archaeon]